MVEKEGSISFARSMIPIIFLVISLTLTINYFEGDAHMPILATAVVAAVVALASGHSWNKLEQVIIDTLNGTLQSMLIFCIIGIVIGMWILSGIVPTMIYYGLKIISPKIFLVTACLIAAIISLATGSSWTTVGTVGIAIMGMGHGLNIPLPIVAGAVVSGAYFGDKLSPLSDTTNLASGVVNVDIFEHIKAMLATTGPSLIIALIIYGILGMKYSSSSLNSESLNIIFEGLNNEFVISPFLLIPPLFIILMVVKKIPAIPGLIISALIGIALAIFVQGAEMGEVIGSAHYGYISNSGIDVIDELLSGGGLDSMMWPLSLVFISMSLAGIMEGAGMIDAIAKKILSYSNSRGGLILATVLTSISVNLVTGDQYLSIVFTGKMYNDEYKKQGLHPKILSRTLEDSGTLTSPLVPWGACAVFMATTLKVSTLAYLPFTFLNLINPMIAIIYGYTGLFMEDLEKKGARHLTY